MPWHVTLQRQIISPSLRTVFRIPQLREDIKVLGTTKFFKVMNTTKVVGATKSAAQLLANARPPWWKAKTKTKDKSVAPQLPKDRPDHGHKIYVFNNLLTNQVVYSLTKSMKNNKAISQLSFSVKKSVPRALRKDLWTPMATITFPPTPSTSAQGLLAFRILREYRILHETQWDEELREKAKNKVEFNVPYSREELSLMNKQEKKIVMKRRKKGLGKILSDQKANSIADMAAVLAKLDFNPPVEEVVVEKEVVSEKTTDASKSQFPHAKTEVETPETEVIAKTEGSTKDVATDETKEKEAEVKEPAPEVPKEIRVAPDDAPIVVHWKDVLDAEYAESWPVGVVHDFLDPLDAPQPVVVETPAAVEEPATESEEVVLEKEEERIERKRTLL